MQETTQSAAMPQDEPFSILTPAGELLATFPEDGGVVYQGPEEALQLLREALRGQVGRYGQSMAPDGIEPVELVEYFRPAAAGISVVPPLSYFMELDDEGSGAALDAAGSGETPLAQFDNLDSLLEHLRGNGHGHIVPRPNGARARCGVLRWCTTCRQELAALEKLGYPVLDATAGGSLPAGLAELRQQLQQEDPITRLATAAKMLALLEQPAEDEHGQWRVMLAAGVPPAEITAAMMATGLDMPARMAVWEAIAQLNAPADQVLLPQQEQNE